MLLIERGLSDAVVSTFPPPTLCGVTRALEAGGVRPERAAIAA